MNAQSFLNWKFFAESLPLVVENWSPHWKETPQGVIFQQGRKEGRLIINIEMRPICNYFFTYRELTVNTCEMTYLWFQYGGSILNLEIWPHIHFCIMINFTSHALKVKTAEMAYH